MPTAPGSPTKQLVVDNSPLKARVFRLNQRDYRTTIQRLLKLQVTWLPAPADIDPYAANVLLVRGDTARYFVDQAADISQRIDSAALAAAGDCQSLDATCEAKFVAKLTEKLFRRAPLAAELQPYQALFAAAKASPDATFPFRSVLKALLISPHFLYRTELGPESSPDNATFQLTAEEAANFLSYGLLGEPPSAELLAIARRGELVNREQLRTQVESLLARPEAAERLREFLSHWIQAAEIPAIDKDPVLFPGFDAERIPGLMAREASAFLAQVGVLTGSAAALLTAPVPSVDPALDAFYAGDSSNDGRLTRVGVLALGGVLASPENSRFNLGSPVKRGLFVRKRVLCGNVEQPPASVNTQIDLPSVTGMAKTTREAFSRHAADPTCAGCHALIDPMGFTFESFDGAGRFRTLENGLPVDTAGMVVGSTDQNGVVANYVELSSRLSKSVDFTSCLAVQGFRFYYGQYESARGVPIAAAEAATALATQNGVLQELLRALFASDNVLQRRR